MIGDFGVGKTSTVAQFVHQAFSEKYLTTVGVKVDTKPITLDDQQEIKLVIWDIAGTDTASPGFISYLRGTAGYLLVADCTRNYTLDNALNLQQQLQPQLGDCPWVGLLNKADLTDEWDINEARENAIMTSDNVWLKTSALTGENVERAFETLARAML